MGIPIRTDDTAALIGGLAPIVEGEKHYEARPDADGTILLVPITAEDYQALRIQRFASEQLGLDLAAGAIVRLIKTGTPYATGGPVGVGPTMGGVIGGGQSYPGIMGAGAIIGELDRQQAQAAMAPAKGQP